MAGAGVPVPSVDDGAIVVAPQACFKVESHENGVVLHLQRGGAPRSWGLRGLEEMQGLTNIRAPLGRRDREGECAQAWPQVCPSVSGVRIIWPLGREREGPRVPEFPP